MPAERPPSEAWTRVEEIVDAFEEALRQGKQPGVEDFFPAGGSLPDGLLEQLLHAELEYRLKAGQEARVEDYLQRYPALSDSRAAVCRLIAVEYHCRRRRGTGVRAEEFFQRFPAYAAELAEHLLETAEHPRRRAVRRLNCPHCHNPIAIVADERGEVVCPACGSSFHLEAEATRTWEPEKLPRLGKFELLEAIGRGLSGRSTAPATPTSAGWWP
jgi:ribosomal protein S27E